MCLVTCKHHVNTLAFLYAQYLEKHHIKVPFHTNLQFVLATTSYCASYRYLLIAARFIDYDQRRFSYHFQKLLLIFTHKIACCF